MQKHRFLQRYRSECHIGLTRHTCHICTRFVIYSLILVSLPPNTLSSPLCALHRAAPTHRPASHLNTLPHPHLITLRLRGAGPKKKVDLFKQNFAPGTLPNWAQKIIDYRNSTTPVQRVREMRRVLEEPRESDWEDSDSLPTSSWDCIWGGEEEGWVDVRKSEMESENDPTLLEIQSSGEFRSVRKRREWVKALRDLHGDRWNPAMLKMGGSIETMWYPDEPLYINVTQRIEVPMALHPDVIHPDRSDPNLLLREAAKLGELYEVERQVRAGADVNSTDPLFSDWTPLHYAAWNNHTSTCQMLIKLGAYKFPQDHASWTPWDCACLRSHWDLAEELQRLGASMPVRRTPIPLNFTGAEDRPFTCVNEYLNPNFTDTDVYKLFTLKWIEDPHHPLPDPLGPPRIPTVWFGTYNPRPTLNDDTDTVMRDDRDGKDGQCIRVEAGESKREVPEKALCGDEEEAKTEEVKWVPDRDALGRIFLTCPFSDKDACKKVGGKWDVETKRWFVPRDKDAGPFSKWWPPKPLNWQGPVLIKKKHAFNVGAIGADSKSHDDSQSVMHEESESDSCGMGNMTYECITPKPADGEYERFLRANPSPKFKHYTNFSERPPNTVVQNWEEDKLKKWAESDMGKMWLQRFEERLKALELSESNEETQFMTTNDEISTKEKCQKIIDLWEETETSRLQLMQEELEKDRKEKSIKIANRTQGDGLDKMTAAERFWEADFEGSPLALNISTQDEKSATRKPKGPLQSTLGRLFGLKKNETVREGPEPPPPDQGNGVQIEKWPVGDMHELEVAHIDAQQYMAHMQSGQLTEKEKEWFWSDPDNVTSGSEPGLFW